jgi:hypothetical protein
LKPAINELLIGDRPERWAAIGFDLAGDGCHVGNVRLRFEPGAGTGLLGWTLRGVESTELNGLPTAVATEPPMGDPGEHPNGSIAVDHVVVLTPDLERTCRALERAGLRLRRIREAGSPERPVRQAFFRLGEVILEVVSSPEAERAAFWGLVFVVEDLERAASLLGDRLGEPRHAVQPGRRIATVRRSAGLSVPVALITPEPSR